MTALFAAELLAIVVALFWIAWGVNQHPAPTQAAPAPNPAVFRRDIAYINVGRKGGGVAFREAQQMGYKATARDGDWVTMKRNGGI